MRTETLLLTAAIGVAAAATTMAQVYSVNAVGYVNTTLKSGLQMVANPLDAGTGNNTIAKLFTGVPDGTIVYKYNVAQKKYDVNIFEFGAWGDETMTLTPGEGAFVAIPRGSADTKITFVGDVPLGAASNMQLTQGLQLAGSKVPQAGKISTDLKFPATDGDLVYTWDYAGQKYNTYVYEFGAWGEEPTINVGEGFWVAKSTAAAWDRNFSIAQ